MRKTYEFKCWDCGKEFKTKARRPKKCSYCKGEKVARQFTTSSSSRYRTKLALMQEKHKKDLLQPTGKNEEHFEKVYGNPQTK